jgi:ribose transport system substrate-binding protein
MSNREIFHNAKSKEDTTGISRVRICARSWTAVAALVVAGCSFGSAISASAADSETQGKTVAFVPGVMGNAFYVTMECGIRDEAAKYGLKINIQGPQQFDPSLQTPIVNAVVAAKPAGLLIAPTDSKAMFVPISQAVSAGIKVALVDTTLDDTSKVITAIATDNTAGGAAAADALAKLIGEKGEVIRPASEGVRG